MRRIVSRWPTNLLLPVLVAGVETAAIAPLIHLFGPGFLLANPSPAPWPVAVAVTGLVAFWSTRLFTTLGLSLRVGRVLSLVVWLGTVVIWIALQYGTWNELNVGSWLAPAQRYLALPVVLSLIAWWRGLTYGSDPTPFTSDALRVVVRTAWIALVIELLIAATMSNPTAHDALASGRLAVPVAVICGLLAVATAQIEQARQTARRRSGHTPERRTWLAFAVVATAVIVLVGLLVGGLLGHDVWSVLYHPVVIGLRWLSIGLLYALLAFAFVLFLLLSPVLWLARFALRGSAPPKKPAITNPPDFSKYAHHAQSHLAPNLVLGIRWALVLIIVPLVALAVLGALRRYHDFRKEEDVDERRESLWSRDMALKQLRGLFGSRQRPAPAGKPLDLSREPVTVRDAYRFLTVLAARDGAARPPSETPSEFSARIGRKWADVGTQIDDLTSRYLRVRYGDHPDEPERDGARADWRAIWHEHQPDHRGE